MDLELKILIVVQVFFILMTFYVAFGQMYFYNLYVQSYQNRQFRFAMNYEPELWLLLMAAMIPVGGPIVLLIIYLSTFSTVHTTILRTTQFLLSKINWDYVSAFLPVLAVCALFLLD